MTANSTSFESVSWEASFVKTKAIRCEVSCGGSEPTQTWCEKCHVQVRNELLRLRVEHALSGYDIPWQTDAYYFKYGLKHKQNEVAKRGVRRMRRRTSGLLESQENRSPVA
jgi:hypothetical protein